MGTDNPRDPQMRDILKRLKKVEVGSFLGYSSISEGSLEVRSNEGLLVDGSAKVNGWLVVTGTERVTGRLEGSGTFDWTGPMNLKGAQSVTGPTTFTGKVDINGNVDINGPLNVLGTWKLTGNGDIAGNVNLTGDMAVKSGGSITVQGGGGNVTLSSTYGSPRINLGGAQIDGGSSFTFTAGTNTVYFKDGTVRIAGMPTVMQSSYPGSFPGAVVADTSGRLYRVVG